MCGWSALRTVLALPRPLFTVLPCVLIGGRGAGVADGALAKVDRPVYSQAHREKRIPKAGLKTVGPLGIGRIAHTTRPPLPYAAGA
jgi:hypothetical protein